MNKKILRKIIAAVLSFAGVVLTFCAVVCLILGITLSSGVVELFITDEYIKNVKNEILTELESYAIPGGLPADFFEDKFDIGLLKSDIERAVESAFTGDEYSANDFKNGLLGEVEGYAADNGIAVTADDENITRLVSLCVKTYETYTLSAPIKYIGVFSSYINPLIYFVGAAAIAVSLLLLVCAGKLGGKFYLKSGISGAAVMLLAPIFILVSGSVGRLGITSISMFSIVTGLIYTVLISMIASGLLMLIFANIKLPFSRKGK